MRASRAVMVAGGCAAIVGAGWAASPKELPTLDLVAPSSPEASPSATATATAEPGGSADPTEDPSPAPTPSITCEPDDSGDDEDDDKEREDDDCAITTPAPAATTPSPTPTATATAQADEAPASSTHDGPVVSNLRGDFQARITVTGGEVTDVQAIAAGTRDSESVQINARAIPVLRDEVLAAQTWDVAAVSGASYTSQGFTESLRGAFAEAGL
ncbi:FMN-binding protein [Demequina sp. SYSU T00192]|uniref:FMN-binding protein n=1 Tax=Demequina litoralis TaxID=3051660 RepID=A0ABT8G9R7_9MICO|nr:FMN-binding protein [Demequina sp. SYSU T00192]MDN4475719.1 FMN-binding protein [Demequina sp. SYSU T00192]